MTPKLLQNGIIAKLYIRLFKIFQDYVQVIYPKELEIKDTTDKPSSASYLDLRLEIDNEEDFLRSCTTNATTSLFLS